MISLARDDQCLKLRKAAYQPVRVSVGRRAVDGKTFLRADRATAGCLNLHLLCRGISAARHHCSWGRGPPTCVYDEATATFAVELSGST